MGYSKGNPKNKINEFIGGWFNSNKFLSVIAKLCNIAYCFGTNESHANTNFMVAAYDFLNSNENNFNVSIWYNSTYDGPSLILRVLRAVNMVCIPNFRISLLVSYLESLFVLSFLLLSELLLLLFVCEVGRKCYSMDFVFFFLFLHCTY